MKEADTTVFQAEDDEEDIYGCIAPPPVAPFKPPEGHFLVFSNPYNSISAAVASPWSG